MTCEECEALGLLAQQHCCQITMAQTNLTVVSNGTRNAERLQADADCLSSVGCIGAALLDCDCSAYYVSPAGILECDRLYRLNGSCRINALILTDLSSLFQACNAVLSQNSIDLLDSSFVTLK